MGPDMIPNIILKTCAEELAQPLCDIFRFSLDSGELPADWRNANVTPIFKQEGHDGPDIAHLCQ